MIVKRQFGASFDVLVSKYADPGLPLHTPLSCLAVGVAAVIDEAGVVGLLTCIDDETLVQRQHVEVVGVVLVCLLYPLLAHLHVENLADVLDDEIPRRQILLRLQTPPPSSRVERGSLGILTLLHALVLTESADRAVSRVTLDVDGPVDAGGVVVAGMLRRTLTG